MATYHNGQWLDDGTDPQPEEMEEAEDYANHVESLAQDCTCSGDRPCESLLCESLLCGGTCETR